jgi:hypothetical protein
MKRAINKASHAPVDETELWCDLTQIQWFDDQNGHNVLASERRASLALARPDRGGTTGSGNLPAPGPRVPEGTPGPCGPPER